MLAAVGSLAGCTWIMQGTSQEVTFTSDPPGAQVTVAGQTVTTPATLDLPKADYVVTFVKPGYQDATLELTRKVSPYFYASLFMGIIASGIDMSTGAWKEFATTELHAPLTPAGPIPISLTSRPAGAEIRLDGRFLGHTPLTASLEWLPTAPSKSVEIAKEGYDPVQITLTHKETNIEVDLKEIVETTPLHLVVHPVGATIQVDGAEAGAAPLRLELRWSVTLQRHTLTLSHPGYATVSIGLTREEVKDLLEIRLSPRLPKVP